jgi:biopolymer transport protein ExbB
MTPESWGGLELLLGHTGVAGAVLKATFATSVIVIALAVERTLALYRFRRDLRVVDGPVLSLAREGDFAGARKRCDELHSAVGGVFAAGLDRALGKVKGHPASALLREQKRALGQIRSGVWVLGTAGAMMPFVGLFGTVIGVMGSFQAIGEAGSGGFPIVSEGISEALVATAGGLFVALEAVLLYNMLQNAIARTGRDVALLVDEVIEILEAEAAPPQGGLKVAEPEGSHARSA